ncbi:MAG: hypothetical protein AB1791_03360 [Chloroflexota bacterium]
MEQATGLPAAQSGGLPYSCGASRRLASRAIRRIALQMELIVEIVLMVHSIVRWLIVGVGVLAVLDLAVGWLFRRPFGQRDRGLVAAFTGLMDLQVLLGIIFLVWSGLAEDGFPFYRIAHGLIMLVAAGAAHLNVRWKTSPDRLRFRTALTAIVIALLLVTAGVAVLPDGLSR